MIRGASCRRGRLKVARLFCKLRPPFYSHRRILAVWRKAELSSRRGGTSSNKWIKLVIITGLRTHHILIITGKDRLISNLGFPGQLTSLNLPYMQPVYCTSLRNRSAASCFQALLLQFTHRPFEHFEDMLLWANHLDLRLLEMGELSRTMQQGVSNGWNLRAEACAWGWEEKIAM